MNSATEFERDIERYLRSKLPDIPEHTAMEIATYVSDRTAIFTMDFFNETLKPISRKRPRYLPYYHRPENKKIPYEDIVFDTPTKAIEVVEGLNRMIDLYWQARVSDLYDLAEIECDYIPSNYGWCSKFNPESVVQKTKGGWKLALPKPVPLE